MNEMTVKEVLIAARAKIADPVNWTQGEYARNADGADCEGDDAVCWCAIGAIQESCDDYDTARDALEYLHAVMGTYPYHFNDTHTHAEVIAKFDEAIAAQGGE